MTFPHPTSVLRHRPPAVLVGSVVAFSGDRLTCRSVGSGPWEWPQLLEGGAQTAGLLAGAQPDGLHPEAVIADYRGVRVLAATHAGLVSFVASIERKIMHFWRCRIEARAEDGRLLLDGLVTLAPTATRKD